MESQLTPPPFSSKSGSDPRYTVLQEEREKAKKAKKKQKEPRNK